MLSTKSATLQIKLNLSLPIIIFVLVIYIATASLIVSMQMLVALKWLIAAMLLVGLVVSLHRLGAIQIRSLSQLNYLLPIRNMTWNSDNIWQVSFDREQYLLAELLATTVVHPKLVILNFEIDSLPRWQRRRSVVITVADIPNDLFRSLQVRLRLHGMNSEDNWSG